jgi:hypothetical protein
MELYMQLARIQGQKVVDEFKTWPSKDRENREVQYGRTLELVHRQRPIEIGIERCDFWRLVLAVDRTAFDSLNTIFSDARSAHGLGHSDSSCALLHYKQKHSQEWLCHTVSRTYCVTASLFGA